MQGYLDMFYSTDNTYLGFRIPLVFRILSSCSIPQHIGRIYRNLVCGIVQRSIVVNRLVVLVLVQSTLTYLLVSVLVRGYCRMGSIDEELRAGSERSHFSLRRKRDE